VFSNDDFVLVVSRILCKCFSQWWSYGCHW